jgi:hypothetical protein
MRAISSIVALTAVAATVAGCAQETSYPRYGYSQATYYPSAYSYPTSYGYRSSAYEYRHYNGIHPGPETWP